MPSRSLGAESSVACVVYEFAPRRLLREPLRLPTELLASLDNPCQLSTQTFYLSVAKHEMSLISISLWLRALLLAMNSKQCLFNSPSFIEFIFGIP